MDKHTKAIECLSILKDTQDAMKKLYIEREEYTNMALKCVDINEIHKIKPKIQECDAKYNSHMSKYIDAMSYLSLYNDEFNDSKQWRRWMKIRR